MPSISRRRALQAAVGAAGLLAGCSGESSTTSSVTPSGRGPPAGARSDLPTTQLRHPGKGLVVRDGTPTTTERDDHLWEHRLVASEEAADALVFADVEGVETAKSFLDETDFDAETVYVEQRTVRACYALQLCWIRWTDERIETAYSRELRPADVACEADQQEAVATFIRLPVAIDPDAIRRHSSGSGGGRCHQAGTGGDE